MFTVVKHKLQHADGTPVPFTPSPNVGTQIVPIYIVIHYTAGLTAEGAIQTLCDPKSKASAHVVLDRDGKVTQLVALNRRAWHAGKSQWGELSGRTEHSRARAGSTPEFGRTAGSVDNASPPAPAPVVSSPHLSIHRPPLTRPPCPA